MTSRLDQFQEQLHTMTSRIAQLHDAVVGSVNGDGVAPMVRRHEQQITKLTDEVEELRNRRISDLERQAELGRKSERAIGMAVLSIAGVIVGIAAKFFGIG